jgi:peptidoglycan/LPS O-acetylase OafA/YrhL
VSCAAGLAVPFIVAILSLLFPALLTNCGYTRCLSHVGTEGCAFFVVIHHTNLRIKFNKSWFGALLPEDINRGLFWTGSYSVKIFFVISGFLITSTILARWGSLEKIDLRRFYWLRFARIAPCLFGLLTILSVLHLAGAPGFVINPTRTHLPRALFAALTFHSNWLETKVGYLPGAWDILWSLSIEEAFYLFYPLLCRYLKPRYLLAIALALIAAGPFFRTVLAPNEMATDYGYLANMDCIATGCLVAAIPIRLGRLASIAGWILLAAIVFVRSRVFPKPVYASGLDVTLLALTTALILQFAVNRVRFVSPLLWFGRNSYEIYLTHMFVVTFGTQWFAAHHLSANLAPAWFAGTVAAAGLLGFAVAHWYSEPLNRKLRLLRRPVSV